jgi:predicted RNase H-like HicB family nuclease
VTTKIAASLEIGSDGTGAFVPNCPGCWVFGQTPESALNKVKTAIADWFEWLRRHGEQVLIETRNFDIEVSEMMQVNYNPVKAGKPEPLFWSEVSPVTKKDFARTLQLMRYSREDLLKIVFNLSKDRLNRRHPDEPRTISNCLRHIAYVEPWYINRLNIDLSCEYARNVFELLDNTRNAVADCLGHFPHEKMRGVFQPTRDTSSTCNLWTARKVLRRLVDHERLHTKYIERILRTYAEKEG